MKLSALDQIMPRAYTPFPLTFTLKRNTREDDYVAAALHHLSRSFQELVEEIDFLRGHVAVVPSSSSSSRRKGELEVQFNGGANARPRLVVREFLPSDAEEEEEEEEEGRRRFDVRYLPIGGDGSAPVAAVQLPVFAAQVNKIEDGIVLCVCLHHSVMDGMGMAAVLGRWAERCCAISRGGVVGVVAPLDKACLDRGAVVNGGRRNEDVKHPSYSIENVVLGMINKDAQEQLSEPAGKPRLVGRCFLLKREEAAKTKVMWNQMFQSQEKPGQRLWVSTNDVLCAILWHAITRARLAARGQAAPEGKRSKLGVPVNVRSKIIPPLPRNYMGNATVDATAERSITALATWTTPELAHTALTIRQAICSVDDAYVRALIDVVDGLEDARSIKASRADFLGDDLTISNWLEMGICQMDWGDTVGKIEENTPSFDGFDGLCIILPRRRAGSVKIMVGLEEKAMERLEKDEDFGKYAEVVDRDEGGGSE